MLKKIKSMYIAILIVVLIMTCIPLAPSEAAADKIKPRITIYGTDAEAFASLITQFETVSSNIIVISEIGKTNTELLTTALDDEGILVAVNLPKENDLVTVPVVEKITSTEYLVFNSKTENMQASGITEISTENMYPNYWISVIQKGSRSDFLLIQVDSQAMRDRLYQKAAGTVANIVEEFMQTTTLEEGTDDFEKRAEYNQLVLFGTNQADQFYIRHEILELQYWDTTTNKEYWRIDSTIDSYIPEYGCSFWRTGPYIASRQIIVDASSSADLYTYSPNTTPSDVGVSVGVGFSFSSSGGGTCGVNYGWSWTNPGVSYTVDADYANRKVTTEENFRLPDYTWFPYIIEPTANSHTSYQTKMTCIIREPVGHGFEVEQLKSQWTINDDYTIWYGYFIGIHRNTYTYSLSWGPLAISSLFS